MARILVIHGAGMNMRGKVQTEIFGPMTLPEYDERIRGYATELGLEVEIFHSNIEGEIVNKLYEANDRGFDAAIFNPAAFGSGYPALVAAISHCAASATSSRRRSKDASLSALGGGEGRGEVGDSRALADTHLTLPALRRGPLPLPPEGRRGVFAVQ